MEQKRTIWIVLAAGIFLMVVIGAAVILYAPESRKNTTAYVQNENGTVWMSPEVAQHKREDLMASAPVTEVPAVEQPASEMPSVTDSIETPAEGATQLENLTVISTGSTNVYSVGSEGPAVIDLNTVESERVPAVKAQNHAAEVAIKETNSIRRNVETNDVLVEKTYKSEPKAAPKKAEPKAAERKTESVAVKKVQGPAPKAAPKAAAKTEKVPDRFWVQAASYSAKKNADEARAVLEKNKIQCEVFTHTDAKGGLFYRVRVGPYTTQTEAKYWKTKIDAIPLFANNGTYVTNSSVNK